MFSHDHVISKLITLNTYAIYRLFDSLYFFKGKSRIDICNHYKQHMDIFDHSVVETTDDYINLPFNDGYLHKLATKFLIERYLGFRDDKYKQHKLNDIFTEEYMDDDIKRQMEPQETFAGKFKTDRVQLNGVGKMCVDYLSNVSITQEIDFVETPAHLYPPVNLHTIDLHESLQRIQEKSRTRRDADVGGILIPDNIVVDISFMFNFEEPVQKKINLGKK